MMATPIPVYFQYKIIAMKREQSFVIIMMPSANQEASGQDVM